MQEKSSLWQRQYEIIKNIFSSAVGGNASQPRIAAHVGVPRHRVQAWEGGQRPSADDLERIARTLQLSPRWLLLGEGEPLDAEEKPSTPTQADTADPIVQRMLEAERILRSTGATNEVIQQVICDLAKGAGDAPKREAGQEVAPEFRKAGNGR